MTQVFKGRISFLWLDLKLKFRRCCSFKDRVKGFSEDGFVVFLIFFLTNRTPVLGGWCKGEQFSWKHFLDSLQIGVDLSLGGISRWTVNEEKPLSYQSLLTYDLCSPRPFILPGILMGCWRSITHEPELSTASFQTFHCMRKTKS